MASTKFKAASFYTDAKQHQSCQWYYRGWCGSKQHFYYAFMWYCFFKL